MQAQVLSHHGPTFRQSEMFEEDLQSGMDKQVQQFSMLMQVWRWAQQYRAQLSGEPMPEMMQLHAWLQANVPASDDDASQTRIAHGDYK